MHSEIYLLHGSSTEQISSKQQEIAHDLGKTLGYDVQTDVYEIDSICAIEVRSYNKDVKMRQFVLAKLKTVLSESGLPVDKIASYSALMHEKRSRFDFGKVFLQILSGSMFMAALICILRVGYHYFFSKFPEDWLVSYATTFGIWTMVFFVVGIASAAMDG